MDTILVFNAGSSSIKFETFQVAQGGALRRQIEGQIDGVGSHPRLRAKAVDGAVLADRPLQGEAVPDVSAATGIAGDWLRNDLHIDPAAVGHRVVHGGADHDEPVLIDDDVIARIERLVPLAPLHQPHNLAAIRYIRANFPAAPQVACFDTAFHRTHGETADYYGLPYRLHAEGVRRYGFHGLSYEYIARTLLQVAPAIAKGRVIVAHLGNGASMCALKDGRSLESTMGFTALDGLPMGTRPGQIDPGVLLYLMSEKGMQVSELQDFLYHDCGLKGLSGISHDMRELEASEDPHARLAIDYFVYRIGLNAGMLAAALQGLDAFVFTAGIGENSALVRARVAEQLAWLGAALDPAENARHAQLISRPGSLPIYVVPTDEEWMVAQHTLSLLSRQRDRAARE